MNFYAQQSVYVSIIFIILFITMMNKTDKERHFKIKIHSVLESTIQLPFNMKYQYQ